MTTRVLCWVPCFWKSCLYEVVWKNIVDPGRTQMTVWRMRIACRIPKSTNTHSEYVIRTLVFPFHYKNVLQEHASILHYMYNAGLAFICFVQCTYGLQRSPSKPGKRFLYITKISGWNKRSVIEVHTNVVTDTGSCRTRYYADYYTLHTLCWLSPTYQHVNNYK